MTTNRIVCTSLALLAVATVARAQEPGADASQDRRVTAISIKLDEAAKIEAGKILYTAQHQAFEAGPLDGTSVIRNAPFSAEAVTEFTQVFADGNRIERRYASSIARDSQGRTRREEEIALVGPLAAGNSPARLVTILDPVSGTSYTLDDERKVAHRNQMAIAKLREMVGRLEAARKLGVEQTKVVGLPDDRRRIELDKVAERTRVLITQPLGTQLDAAFAGERIAASKVVVEDVGTRTIEGLKATGTRTTTTIPAGAIGNVLPIAMVTERWFSDELQTAVLITRSDPRSGETVYRLTNVVRLEPPADLFTVPAGYEIRTGGKGGAEFRMLRKIER